MGLPGKDRATCQEAEQGQDVDAALRCAHPNLPRCYRPLHLVAVPNGRVPALAQVHPNDLGGIGAHAAAHHLLVLVLELGVLFGVGGVRVGKLAILARDVLQVAVEFCRIRDMSDCGTDGGDAMQTHR